VDAEHDKLPSSVNQVDSTCDDQQLVHRADRPTVSAEEYRRSGSSATEK